MGARHRTKRSERHDAAVVCRPAVRTLLQRSFAYAATDRDSAGLGQRAALQRAIRMTRPLPRTWADGWNIATPDLVLPMPKPVTIPAGRRRGIHLRDRAYAFHRRQMDTDGGSPSLQPAVCASCRGLHPAAVILNGCGTRPSACRSPLRRSAIRRSVWKRTEPPATCYWSTRPAVRRTVGRTEWQSLSRRDRTWFFRCTTPRTARREATGRASGWCSPRRRREQRVITLQLNDHAFIIPPGADNFRGRSTGHAAARRTLLSLFPHMHLRGKRFEYDIVHPDGSIETAVARELSLSLATELPAGRTDAC